MTNFSTILRYSFLYKPIYWIFQNLEFARWILDKDISTPHIIKQKVVKQYAKEYQIQTFIETGTYLGTMINAVKNNFKEIFTIELDKTLFLLNQKKFKGFKRIKIFQGDSAIILPKLISRINSPILFWLDAHFSKGITAKGPKETPILEELHAVLNHNVKAHVILIDDANAFTGHEGYPSIQTLRKKILTKFPHMSFDLKQNIIRLTPLKSAIPQEDK